METSPHPASLINASTYCHILDSLLPHDACTAPIQRCLSAGVTTAQDKPSLAPYGSIPAAAVDKVFELRQTAHEILGR